MQNQKDDTLANIGTTPASNELSNTTTFSAGAPRFSLPNETYELAISFEVSNVELNSSMPIGSAIFKLNLDSALSPWLDNFQYFTFKDLSIDMQCTSPLGTSSGAILVSYMSDPVNADVPSDPVLAKRKFGVTFPRVIIRPRDNKSLALDVQQNPMLGGWRCVKRGAETPAEIRQTSFGTVVAIVNSQPAAADGATFTTWVQGTLVAKGRTEVTQGAYSLKAQCTINHILNSGLTQDETGWAVVLLVKGITSDIGAIKLKELAERMNNHGVWPVVSSTSGFNFKIKLQDGTEEQKITFTAPIMYISGFSTGSEEVVPIFYLPIPSHEEVYLLDPHLVEVSPINNQDIEVYLDVEAAGTATLNSAPMRRKRILRKIGNKNTESN